MFENLTGSYKATAKLSGSKLVLSLPDAITPCIWSLDLDTSDSAMLRLDTGADGLTHLVHDKGDEADIIASYAKRSQAMRIMMSAARAIGKYERQGMAVPSKKRQGLLRFLGLIAVIAFALWAVAGLFFAGPNPSRADFEAELQRLIEQSGRVPNIEPRVDPNSTGVPIPLEDFLERSR